MAVFQNPSILGSMISLPVTADASVEAVGELHAVG